MAQEFTPGKPVTTSTSFVDVLNRLAPGVHTFTLVVVDDQGNQSALTRATVTVRPSTTGGGGPIPTGPILTEQVVNPGNPMASNTAVKRGRKKNK
jgi:hypothetical protein